MEGKKTEMGSSYVHGSYIHGSEVNRPSRTHVTVEMALRIASILVRITMTTTLTTMIMKLFFPVWIYCSCGVYITFFWRRSSFFWRCVFSVRFCGICTRHCYSRNHTSSPYSYFEDPCIFQESHEIFLPCCKLLIS